MTEPLFPSAIQRAQQLDSILQRTGKPVGPLHGLPVSVKDCFRIKGVDSCIGLTALALKPSTSHARLVTMLLSLGAVIIAKTNVSQGMAAPDSYNHVFGCTLNPLNHQLTVGGSSGGEAALVAMRGSMVGFGTDIGGSIRVPAMCTGLYGFKPSVGRIPFGGVVTGQPPGLGRVSLQGVAGPLARSVADLGTVLDAIVPIAERFGEDCIPAQWESESPVSERQTREFTVGVLRTDGLVTPLPPVARVLDEVAESLRRTPGVRVVDVPVPPGLSKCQGIAGRLMSADGGGSLLDLLQSTSEPLIPWLQKRIKRREALTLEQLVHLQEQRSDVEKELLGMWTVDGDCTRRIDAIITPVAPHPVPEIDRFNAIGYTASFVLLDYPAGTIPVRNLTESDLDSDQGMNSPELGSWDRVNRDLCMRTDCFLRCKCSWLTGCYRAGAICRPPRISGLAFEHPGGHAETTRLRTVPSHGNHRSSHSIAERSDVIKIQTTARPVMRRYPPLLTGCSIVSMNSIDTKVLSVDGRSMVQHTSTFLLHSSFSPFLPSDLTKSKQSRCRHSNTGAVFPPCGRSEHSDMQAANRLHPIYGPLAHTIHASSGNGHICLASSGDHSPAVRSRNVDSNARFCLRFSVMSS